MTKWNATFNLVRQKVLTCSNAKLNEKGDNSVLGGGEREKAGGQCGWRE